MELHLLAENMNDKSIRLLSRDAVLLAKHLNLRLSSQNLMISHSTILDLNLRYHCFGWFILLEKKLGYLTQFHHLILLFHSISPLHFLED